jgi:hypothetical protein
LHDPHPWRKRQSAFKPKSKPDAADPAKAPATPYRQPAPIPTSTDQSGDSYHPGRIRHESDREMSAILAYTAAFPELAKLPHDAIVDAAGTFRTDARREEREYLREIGALDWSDARRETEDA